MELMIHLIESPSGPYIPVHEFGGDATLPPSADIEIDGNGGSAGLLRFANLHAWLSQARYRPIPKLNPLANSKRERAAIANILVGLRAA